MEDDRIFDFMSKIYGEMKQGFENIDKRFKAIDKRFENLESDMGDVKKDIGKIYSKIDGDITDKLKALGDGYKQNYELTVEVRDKVNVNTEAILEINMALTDMKEDINYIAGKTIKHDSRINKLSEQLKAVK